MVAKSYFRVLLISLLAIIAFASCSDIEPTAKEHLKSIMREYLKNPDTAKLEDVKAVYKSDSLCVLDFKCRAQNSYGGYVSSNMEYIYFQLRDTLGNDVPLECIAKIGTDKNDDFSNTVLESSDDLYNKYIQEGRDSISKDETVKRVALIRCLLKGRQVKDKDDGKKGEDMTL